MWSRKGKNRSHRGDVIQQHFMVWNMEQFAVIRQECAVADDVPS